MFPNLPLPGTTGSLPNLNVAGLRVGVCVVPLLVNNGISAADLHGLDGLAGEGEAGGASLGGEKVFEAGEHGVDEFRVARNANAAGPKGGAAGIGGNGGEVWKNLLVGCEVLPAAECFFLFHGVPFPRNRCKRGRHEDSHYPPNDVSCDIPVAVGSCNAVSNGDSHDLLQQIEFVRRQFV